MNKCQIKIRTWQCKPCRLPGKGSNVMVLVSVFKNEPYYILYKAYAAIDQFSTFTD